MSFFKMPSIYKIIAVFFISIIINCLMFRIFSFTVYAIEDSFSEMKMLKCIEMAEIKEKPDETSKVLATLDKDVLVLKISENGLWTRVRYKEFDGYIKTEMLSLTHDSQDLETEFASMDREARTLPKRLKHLKIQKFKNTIFLIAIIIIGFGGLAGLIIRKLHMHKIMRKEIDIMDFDSETDVKEDK